MIARIVVLGVCGFHETVFDGHVLVIHELEDDDAFGLWWFEDDVVKKNWCRWVDVVSLVL